MKRRRVEEEPLPKGPPKKKTRNVFSDPLLTFDESETVEDARLNLARKMIDSIQADGGDSDLESDAEDYAEQVLRKKALLEDNKWAISWARKLEEKIGENNLSRDTVKGHRYAVTCVCVSSDEKYFFSGSKDGTIIIWDLAKRKKLKVFKRDPEGHEGHHGGVLALAINTEGTYLASGGEGPFLYIWDLRTQTLKHHICKHNKDITALSFQQDTNTLYCGSADRKISVIDASGGIWKETLVGPTESITCLDSLAKPTFVCSGMDKALRFFKVETGKHLIFPKAHKGTVDCVSLISHERWVSGGSDGNISLWGPHKRKNLSTKNKAHNGNWVLSLASRAYADVFVSGSSDGFINFYEIADDNIKFIGKLEVSGYVNALAISKKGNYLICGIGKEHRLGRWGNQIRKAKNGVVIFRLDGEEFTPRENLQNKTRKKVATINKNANNTLEKQNNDSNQEEVFEEKQEEEYEEEKKEEETENIEEKKENISISLVDLLSKMKNNKMNDSDFQILGETEPENQDEGNSKSEGVDSAVEEQKIEAKAPIINPPPMLRCTT